MMVLLKSNDLHYFTYRQLMKTTIILVPLLGFTWIIGLFAVEKEGKVFAYLFVFANVFQVRLGLMLCHLL